MSLSRQILLALAPVATEPRPGLTSLAYVLPRDESRRSVGRDVLGWWTD